MCITGRQLRVSIVVALSLGSAAWAQPGDRHDSYRWHGDIHEFHTRDYAYWREGRWVHDTHGGRFGWWWTVGGLWYFYPAPVYPYPDPYTPATVTLQQPPASAPTPPPAAQNWYYCNSSRNYYPYVDACPEGWQMVPAAPNR